MKNIEFNHNHILVQSMTNTKTHDINATISQINNLAKAGCHLVRVAVFDELDVDALSTLVNLSPIPIIADIHFNYLYAIKAIQSGVFKIRLNPGNITKKEEIEKIITEAKKYNTWIRIGINSGSIPEDMLNKSNGDIVEASIKTLERYLEIFKNNNFNKIVISLKSSDPITNKKINEIASQKFNYPIHAGVTEAGTLLDATIKSCIGLVPLLEQKIPSTIRISISDDPIQEIKVAYKILNNLKIMNNRVNIISCPTCGRLSYKLFEVVNEIEQYCQDKHFPLTISILGCVVNGIGEGKHADIGIAGSNEKAIIFEKGKILKTIDANLAIDEIKLLIDKYYIEYLKKSL